MNAEQSNTRARSGRSGNAGARLALGASLALACWPPEVSVSNAPASMDPDTVSGVGSQMPAPPPAQPMGVSSPNTEEMPAVTRPMGGTQTSAQPVGAAADAGVCGLDGAACCAAPEQACAEGLQCDGGDSC